MSEVSSSIASIGVRAGGGGPDSTEDDSERRNLTKHM